MNPACAYEAEDLVPARSDDGAAVPRRAKRAPQNASDASEQKLDIAVSALGRTDRTGECLELAEQRPEQE